MIMNHSICLRFTVITMVAISLVACVTSPPLTTHRSKLSGKTDIPLLLPGELMDSWQSDEPSFDGYRYYMISKYSVKKDSTITIIASDGEECVAETTDKTVDIPEIGKVRYRRCSVGGDIEPRRYETDPFTRDDGHGGKVYYYVRVTTNHGDQEALMRSVKWAAPGTTP
jgi:hypothetical protein